MDAWILYSKGQHPGYNVTRLFGAATYYVAAGAALDWEGTYTLSVEEVM